MTRFSDYFGLGISQAALDFVDIDVVEDSPVYIDPHAVRTQEGAWIERCQHLITTFFDALLDAIRRGDEDRLHRLVVPLSEPNETHLGESDGPSRGRSLGSSRRAEKLIASLRRSRAIRSGLISDLEETILFVDNIGVDILSDITTAIIRSELIAYTQNQCQHHGIATEPQYADRTWDPDSGEWLPGSEHLLPRGPEGLILLVPKSIVRVRPELDKDRFFRGYLRPFYEQEELNKGVASEFVRLIAAGTRRARLKVNLTDLGEHLGTAKADIARQTEEHPQALVNYRSATSEPSVPLGLENIPTQGSEPVNFGELLAAIGAIAPGAAGATPYHRSIAALLSALFTASLGNQRIETPIHDGIKRIDITYDNVAGDGFFRWLSLNYPAAMVVVECKNYSQDPVNPEVDQIAMRMSPQRGKFGLLITRQITDRSRMDARCRSAAIDGHAYVIALDDDDLHQIVSDVVSAMESGANPREFPLLRQRFGVLLGEL